MSNIYSTGHLYEYDEISGRRDRTCCNKGYCKALEKSVEVRTTDSDFSNNQASKLEGGFEAIAPLRASSEHQNVGCGPPSSIKHHPVAVAGKCLWRVGEAAVKALITACKVGRCVFSA